MGSGTRSAALRREPVPISSGSCRVSSTRVCLIRDARMTFLAFQRLARPARKNGTGSSPRSDQACACPAFPSWIIGHAGQCRAGFHWVPPGRKWGQAHAPLRYVVSQTPFPHGHAGCRCAGSAPFARPEGAVDSTHILFVSNVKSVLRNGIPGRFPFVLFVSFVVNGLMIETTSTTTKSTKDTKTTPGGIRRKSLVILTGSAFCETEFGDGFEKIGISTTQIRSSQR